MDEITVFLEPRDLRYIDSHLKSIDGQTYPKQDLHLFIGATTTGATSRTVVEQYRDRNLGAYRDIILHDGVDDARRASIDYAIRRGTHYVMVDENIVLHPRTLTRLAGVGASVVAPLIHYDGIYSNFHADVDANGYYKGADSYFKILRREIVGLIQVPVVNGCYFIRNDCLSQVTYSDGSNRLPYVVFSDHLRRNLVPQYIDNRFNYGMSMNYAGKNDTEVRALDFLNNKNFYLNLARPGLGCSAPLRPGLKKGVVCDASWLATYLANEHYYLVSLLTEDYGFDVINCKSLHLCELNAIDDLNTYDVLVIAYERSASLPLDRIRAFKIYKLDDLVSYDDAYDRLLSFFIRHSDMVISPYAYAVSRYFTHDNVVWVPYSAALEGCKGHEDVEFNESPICKILASGSVAADRPFRRYVAGLTDPRIEVLPHPGYAGQYSDDGPDITRARYFRELNKYLCCFSDGHQYRYIHLKNFEIASVGSLLLTDKIIEPEMNELGFVDYETCIFADQETFLEKVRWILDPENREEVDRIRRAGMKLVRERHMTKHRAAQVAALIEREEWTAQQ